MGDHDWYRLELTAGRKIEIVVDVVTLEDPYVYIRNASGTILGENDDGAGGRGSRLVFTAPTSGTYYVDVAAWEPTEPVPGYTGIGAYELSVSDYVMPPVGTLDEFAQQLTHGFFDGDSHHFDVTQGGTITVDFTAITDSGRVVALQALQQWSDILGINFVEQSGGAQITFDDLEQGTGAFADTEFTNGITSSAIVNVSLQRLNLHTYMHEIGHALGIGHTSNSNAGTVAAAYPDDAIWSNDGAAISIMSYFDNGENDYYADLGFSHIPIMTPQVADIIAMGNLYGLSTTTRTGDTIYGFNNTSGREAFDATLHPKVAYTIFDSAGVDTLDYSGFSNNQLINLNAEAFSNIGSAVGNVVIARGVLIENAIGGVGADTIVGNAASNVVTGGWGADVLYGGDGNDTISSDRPIGFDGNLDVDTIYGGFGDDMMFAGYGDIVDGGGGFDTLNLSYIGASHGITGDTKVLFAGQPLTPGGGTVQNIERFDAVALTQFADTMVIGDQADPATAYGYDGDDHLIGQENRVVMYGGNGNDLIVGSTANDVLYGDNGNDLVIGGFGGDQLWGGGGNDRFLFSNLDLQDRILDFEAGADKIDLSDLDANALLPGDQAFTFLGLTFFTGNAGELRIYHASGEWDYGGDLIIAGDTDGDLVADLLINIGLPLPESGDFIL